MDVAIIGGGPAGLSAALYALRAGLSVVVIEEAVCGGQMLSAHEIENYPGISAVNGAELAEAMQKQAENLGAEFIYQRVNSVNKSDNMFTVQTAQSTFECSAVIAASGMRRRKLDILGEESLIGRGVSYCALCDGRFFSGRDTAVVGGGNTALGDALYLSRLCKTVTLIHRRADFRADHILEKQVRNTSNIRILTEMRVEKILGEEKLNALELVSTSADSLSERMVLETDGVFIAVGSEPNVEYLSNLKELSRDSAGCIVTDHHCRTNIKGMYAVGDIRSDSIRQIVTAASDGAVAGADAAEYIRLIE